MRPIDAIQPLLDMMALRIRWVGLSLVLAAACGSPRAGDESTPSTEGSPVASPGSGSPSTSSGPPAGGGTALGAGSESSPSGAGSGAGVGTPSAGVEQPPTASLEPPASGSSGSSSGSTSGPTSGPGSGEPSEPPQAAPPPACTSAPTLSAGNQTLSIEHDGVDRTFIVHVPSDLDTAAAVPLVVDMHGLTSSATAQASLSGWRQKADEEGFIVVHPQGLNASWNGGDLCCGTSQRQGVDDEGFIRAMVADIASRTCIDAKRIYATGLSNGGAMSHLLACNAADLFAASAPVSMGNGTRPCEPSRPISVVMTRGTRDTLVSFNGGLFPSAQADFEQWAELNGCQGEPEPVDELCEVFTECEGSVEVKLCALDAGHVLYDNSQDFSVPDVVWETFERQVLP